MLKKARRAFANLSSAFDFGDGTAMTDVDISAGFVAIDGLPSVIRGRARRIMLTQVTTAGVGAATADVSIRPHVAGDWDAIQERGVLQSSAVGTDEDFLISSIGVRGTAGGANLSEVLIVQTGAVAAGTNRNLVAVFDSVGAGDGVMFFSGGSPMIGEFPLIEPPTEQSMSLSAIITTTNAVTVFTTLYGWAVPKGLIVR